MQPSLQRCLPFRGFSIFYAPFKRFLFTAQNEKFFASCNGRIKQISSQHPVIAFDDGKNDNRKFAALRFVNIHKSQGSEFPIVILPVVKSYYRMLRRNLLYTAITRSKKFLILCGEEEALEWGIKNRESSERQTSLQRRLHQAVHEASCTA